MGPHQEATLHHEQRIDGLVDASSTERVARERFGRADKRLVARLGEDRLDAVELHGVAHAAQAIAREQQGEWCHVGLGDVRIFR